MPRPGGSDSGSSRTVAAPDAIQRSMIFFCASVSWRTESGGAPVDASGVLVNGEKVEGPVALKDALLARRALFLRHLTEKMLAYALGRGKLRDLLGSFRDCGGAAAEVSLASFSPTV